MNSYWWQGELHTKSETIKEHEALLIVARSLIYFVPTDEVPTGCTIGSVTKTPQLMPGRSYLHLSTG